jgi:hypothetical protein
VQVASWVHVIHYTVCVARSRWPARLQCLSCPAPTLCCPDPPSAALYSPLFLPLFTFILAPFWPARLQLTCLGYKEARLKPQGKSGGKYCILPRFRSGVVVAIGIAIDATEVRLWRCQHKPRCHPCALANRQILKRGFAP